jgi:FkbM family methyltransferase
MPGRRLLKSVIRRTLRSVGFDLFNSGSVLRVFSTRRQMWGLEPTRDLAKLLGTSTIRTMLDVGANEGQTSRQWVEVFPGATVWAFEPATQPFQRLSTLSQANPRVKSFQLALSDSAGPAEFRTNDFSTLGSLLPIRASYPHGRAAGSERVVTDRLDEFVRRHSIGTVDVLKVDTQGSDLHVLRGAGPLLGRGAVKAVLCELLFEPIYDGQASPADIFAILESAGFRLVCFYDMAASDEGLASWTDALFVHPEGIRRGQGAQ